MSDRPNAVLLDTHVAIWFANGNLGEDATDTILTAGLADGAFVSPVTAWEIGLLTRSGRTKNGLQLLPDPRRWLADLMAQPIIKAAPLTAEIAIDSSFLPGLLHGDPADRLLIATAREMKIALMTRDRKILDYGTAGHVETIAC